MKPKSMRRIIDLLNILTICSVLCLMASCGGNADPDPSPDPDTEITEEHTTDLDFCVLSELDAEVLELIYSRFIGKQVSCEEAKVVFISGKDSDSERIWGAYQRGAAVVVVSPSSDLLAYLSRHGIGFLSAETINDSLFVAFHRSGKAFAMDDFPPKNLNGLVSWVGDVNSANSSGEDLLQSFHLYSSYNYDFDKEIRTNKNKKIRKTGNGSFEQYYSIIPLYAYKSDKSNYVGDFYLIDATFSVNSGKMYSGFKYADYMGFFLTGYKVNISLADADGKEVTASFNQVPSPSTTINSTTYTSGISWSFDAGLSGGSRSTGASLNTGCSCSTSKTRVIRDLAIRDNSDADGNVSYTLEIKNLPTNAMKDSPAISRGSFDFHRGWVWSVANTAEADTTTHYRMKVTLSDLNYRTICHAAMEPIQNWPIDKQEFLIDLPVPNRIPYGKVKFVNSEKDKYMTEIVFTDAKNSSKVYRDQSGSAYSYQQSYEASLPEGTYNVRYKLSGTTYTGSDIVVKRAETKELQSGYYAK